MWTTVEVLHLVAAVPLALLFVLLVRDHLSDRSARATLFFVTVSLAPRVRPLRVHGHAHRQGVLRGGQPHRRVVLGARQGPLRRRVPLLVGARGPSRGLPSSRRGSDPARRRRRVPAPPPPPQAHRPRLRDPRPPHRLRGGALRPRGEPPAAALRGAVVDRHVHPDEDAHGRVRRGIARRGSSRAPRVQRAEPARVRAHRHVPERAPRSPPARPASPPRPPCSIRASPRC